MLRTMEVAVCRSGVYRVLFANDGAPKNLILNSRNLNIVLENAFY